MRSGEARARPCKGGFAAAQPARRRRQSLYTWFNDHRPALVQPRSARPGSRGMHGAARRGGKRTRDGRVKTGAARIEDAGQAVRWRQRRWLGREESYDRRRGRDSGDLASTGVSRLSRARRSGPRASSVSSPGVEELLAACLLPSFAIVSFLSVLVPLQFRLIDMYTYNI